MLYDRKIKYLEYWENGEKVRGAGFVKAELRGTLCRIQINVKGLHETDCFEKQVLLVADKQEGPLCKIRIDGGRGDTGELRLDSRNLGQSGVSYEHLEEIHIPVAAGKEIRCKWQEKSTAVPASGGQPRELSVLFGGNRTEAPKVESSRPEAVRTEPIRLETMKSESSKAGTSEENVPEIKVITWRPEQEICASEEDMPKGSQRAAKRRESSEEWKLPEPERQKEEEPKTGPQPHMFPLDDKWKQLSAIYPHIAPFEDERDYLSLGPSDFVIFPSRYYKVVNNSFLLHGYHNYRHLILVRMESRGEIRYYVGVPGNYYEKEKQVALMFGFESFECKQEPARSGDYGYYMMRVEL